MKKIDTLSKAIQESFNCDSLQDAVQFICEWEAENREFPRFDVVVRELLLIHGIDIQKIKKA